MSNGQDIVRERHFESLASAISIEISNVSVGGGASYDDFSGATSVSSGAAGLVPAPRVGAENYFLRGDGQWASIAGGEESMAYVLSDHVSTIEGGFWAEEVDGVQAMRLRLGNYIYNFNSSSASYNSGSSATATVQPDTYFLDTVPSSGEGGVWYSTDNGEPKICFHSGNYNYGIAYDTVTWVGGNTNLVAYLPFNASTTLDALGNTWTAYGTPTITDGKLYLNGSSYLVNTGISDSIGTSSWTVDFWANSAANGSGQFFGTYNAVYRPQLSGYGDNCEVGLCWENGSIMLVFYNGPDVYFNLGLTQGTRHHYAVTYDGTNVYGFVDGSLKATVPKNVTLGGIFVIGSAPYIGGYFKGYIDHFRIFKGVALWTADFTPPTASDYL